MADRPPQYNLLFTQNATPAVTCSGLAILALEQYVPPPKNTAGQIPVAQLLAGAIAYPLLPAGGNPFVQPPGGPAPADSDDDDDEPRAVPPFLLKTGRALLEDDAAWNVVRNLGWSMKSDGTKSAADVRTAIRNSPHLPRTVQSLVAAIKVVHPQFRPLDNNTLAQLVALGRDVFQTCADSADFLEYVKNELQGVNLANLMKL